MSILAKIGISAGGRVLANVTRRLARDVRIKRKARREGYVEGYSEGYEDAKAGRLPRLSDVGDD